MKKVLIGIFIVCLLFCGYDVYATPGRLRNASIKACNGVTYGAHKSNGSDHWHVATFDGEAYYANGDPIYSDPCAASGGGSKPAAGETPSTKPSSGNSTPSTGGSSSTQSGSNSNKPASGGTSSSGARPSSGTGGSGTTTIVKSSDCSIKDIVIEKKTYTFNNDNKLDISVSNFSLELSINLNNEKAKYEVSGNENFKDGGNVVNILVTAEDGTTKNYVINVYKKSSDATLKKLVIDGSEVTIKDSMDVTTFENSVKAEVFPNNEKATYEIVGADTLVDGDNNYKIIVTAEDGTAKEYIVNIYKYSDAENAIYSLLGWGIIGGSGYGIYRLCKKKKQNKEVK